jgi:hypothetical protein
MRGGPGRKTRTHTSRGGRSGKDGHDEGVVRKTRSSGLRGDVVLIHYGVCTFMFECAHWYEKRASDANTHCTER